MSVFLLYHSGSLEVAGVYASSEEAYYEGIAKAEATLQDGEGNGYGEIVVKKWKKNKDKPCKIFIYKFKI